MTDLGSSKTRASFKLYLQHTETDILIYWQNPRIIDMGNCRKELNLVTSIKLPNSRISKNITVQQWFFDMNCGFLYWLKAKLGET